MLPLKSKCQVASNKPAQQQQHQQIILICRPWRAQKNNNNNNNRRSPAIETIISRQKKNFHFAWKWFIDALSKCQEARQIYQWSVCVSLVSSYSQNYLKGAMIDSWLVAFVFVAVQLNRNNSAIRYRKKNCVSAAEAVATNKSEIKMKSMYAHVHMHMHS